VNQQHGAPGPTDTPAHDDGLVVLTGLAAYLELAAFGLLASRSVDAPDLVTRQSLATVAGRVLARQRRLLDVAAARGRDAGTAMAPFDGVLADFDARTAPDGWAEGLLKGVVGHGVAQDLCRELAAGLPPADGAALRRAVDDDGPEEADAPATVVLAEAASTDEVLASRLALWGRRVVGEALGLVPTLLAAHPALARLAVAARANQEDASADDDVRSWLMSRLTAEHTRRMDRIGLAA
jgi:hypothetical protein